MIRKIGTTAKVFISVACMLLSLQFVYAGEIYRWVDESGVVNYGEKAPPGKDATKIKPDVRKVRTNSSNSIAYKTKPEMKNQQANNLPTKSAEVISKERELNCSIARDNIGRIESGIGVRIAGENADPKLLDAEQRQTWLQHSKEAEAEYCD